MLCYLLRCVQCIAGRSLRDTDRLDDLEYGRTAHDEDEQRQQPRSDGVFFFGGLGRFGHVTALGNVAAGLLVGHADSLLGSHCCCLCLVLRCQRGMCKSSFSASGGKCWDDSLSVLLPGLVSCFF